MQKTKAGAVICRAALHNDVNDDADDDGDEDNDDDYAVVCKRQKQEQAVICRAASHKAPELVFKLSLRNQIINIINIINIFNTISTTKRCKKCWLRWGHKLMSVIKGLNWMLVIECLE